MHKSKGVHVLKAIAHASHYILGSLVINRPELDHGLKGFPLCIIQYHEGRTIRRHTKLFECR